MIGRKIRLERILDRKTGNAVIVPMDHGITSGPLDGLVDVKKTVDEVANGGATAVIMHKGLIEHSHRGFGKDIGLVMHLSASTKMSSSPYGKVEVADVQDALKYGADAVSIHLEFGTEDEPTMLAKAGFVSSECDEWGMPLIIMAYPGGKMKGKEFDTETVAHCARVASELGADIVKVNYTGNPESFETVCKGALAPVVIAGGPKMKTEEQVLNMVRDSVDAGGRGVSIGRNIFQSGNISGMTKAISGIVLKNYSVKEALKLIK